MNFKEFLTKDWNLLNEKAKSKFERLKDNKVPLDSEERAECLKRKAVWHHGIHDPKCAPHCIVPAVWKSKDKNGKITYGCNTHRAYNISDSLSGAIKKFHSFIKGTA
jgi:hypothetical protein